METVCPKGRAGMQQRAFMELKFDVRDNICILSLIGRFTTGSDSEYRLAWEELRKRGVRNTIVNCAELPYIDSTGLSFMVGLHKKLKDDGSRFVLTLVNPRVRSLLELTRLHELIPVFDDLDAALKAIN
jgi:anti-sigma B factor antagonist